MINEEIIGIYLDFFSSRVRLVENHTRKGSSVRVRRFKGLTRRLRLLLSVLLRMSYTLTHGDDDDLEI